MSRNDDTQARAPRWHSALIRFVVPSFLGFSIGGIADDMWRTRSYLIFLMESEEVRIWTTAIDKSDDMAFYELGYIALFFIGLFLWFIWWIWNEPEKWNTSFERLPLLPKILTIPTVLVLGIASGFVANRWFSERVLGGMDLRRPHLEEPWHEMAAFYPQMAFTVLLGLSAGWIVWLVARHFRKQLERAQD